MPAEARPPLDGDGTGGSAATALRLATTSSASKPLAFAVSSRPGWVESIKKF